MAYRLGAVKPHVKNAADHFGPKHGIKDVGGWRAVGSVPNSDHPKGLALDFMTRNKAVGDALAADLIANAGAWNITYIIWWRRIWKRSTGKWEDYSGPSAHTDHVHVSFGPTAGSGSGGVVTVPVGDSALVPDSVENLAGYLRDPAVWRKVGFYIAGVVLILIGIVIVVMGNASPQNIAKVAKKVIAK